MTFIHNLIPYRYHLLVRNLSFSKFPLDFLFLAFFIQHLLIMKHFGLYISQQQGVTDVSQLLGGINWSSVEYKLLVNSESSQHPECDNDHSQPRPPIPPFLPYPNSLMSLQCTYQNCRWLYFCCIMATHCHPLSPTSWGIFPNHTGQLWVPLLWACISCKLHAHSICTIVSIRTVRIEQLVRAGCQTLCKPLPIKERVEEICFLPLCSSQCRIFACLLVCFSLDPLSPNYFHLTCKPINTFEFLF